MSFAPYPSARSPRLFPPPPPAAVLSYAPGAEAPPTREVPHFTPVRVRCGRFAPSRFVRHRRVVTAGLAVTAAALVAVATTGTEQPRDRPGDPPPAHASAPAADRPARTRHAAGLVTAPVRIADAAAVRLLRPGDRVDVVAAGGSAADGGAARVVARGARVTKVPEVLDDDPAGSGALVVLSVPRSTAARLAGAGATARLAVTLW